MARAKRRKVIEVVLLGTLLSALLSLIAPKRWTAASSFYPERRGSSDLTAGLGSLAGLLGAASGGSISLGQSSSQFFADLIKSRTFLDSIARAIVPVDSLGTVERVEDYLVPRARTPQLRHWKARKMVTSAIKVRTMQSGVIVISVTMRSPYAAAAVANRAIEVLDKLNVAYRHREAAARRRFTETFLDDVQSRLADAEAQLVAFQSANRTFETPALMRKQEALQVELNRLRMLKDQLETSIENARLSEYNNAPVVATVDQASVPEQKTSPRRRQMVMGGFLLTLLGVFWALYLRLWI